MAYSDESFFDDEQIRDTDEHIAKVYAGSFVPKNILFNNDLDADVNVEIYGCSKAKPDIHYLINDSILIPAQTKDFQTLEDYFQCFFIHVTAQTLPTSGGFSSEMLMTTGNGN